MISNTTSLSMSTKGSNFTAYCSASTELLSSMRPSETAVRVILYLIVTAVILLTVCGNLLVIISVCHFKELHTPTNVLILSLAFSDILTGLTVMPFHFVWLIQSCWIFGAAMWTLYCFATFVLICQSVYNVTLLALDRFVALNSPFFYLDKVTVYLSFIIAFLSWLFSIFYNFILLYFNGFFTVSPTEEEGLNSSNEILFFADVMVVFVFPCCAMIFLYFRIFAIAQRHTREIKKVNNAVRPKVADCDIEIDQKSERKAAKIIGIVVFVFLLSMVPYYISTLLSGAINDKLLNIIVIYTSSFFFLNSLFNPFIYALFYPSFQKSMKLIITLSVINRDS
ncbi:hypothetical protein ACEWY4_022335 [Coilia grayii]|uniref:G-protein coupled receptors family 1 profile domain-containing protein n=2 Tax=Coilia TaxID=286536 RepID=A0ABD1J5P9_9TELE